MADSDFASILANFKAVHDEIGVVIREPRKPIVRKAKPADGNWKRVRIGNRITNCAVQYGGSAYHHGRYGPCNCGR